MKLTNKWIGYVDRTYQQIKDQVLTRMGEQIPEMTDHTENNPFVQFVSIFSGIAEHLNYWIDSTAREVHLSTARTYKSAVEISQMFNYRLRGVIPATSEVQFTSATAVTSVLTIPIGTKVSTENGIIYVTTREGVIEVGNTSVVIPVSQIEWQENFISQTSGEKNQKFTLPENVADAYIYLTIGGISYSYVDNLAYSISTDTDFTYKLNTDNTMSVRVGDGLQGNLPVAGQTVEIRYALSQGNKGNVAEGAINRLVTQLEVPLTVSNIIRASGGADIESLEDLKRNIPLHNRTQKRAVTEQDYVDTALLVSGVEASGVKFNCGRNVDVYIVPTGGGVATKELLTSVEEYFQDKSMSPFVVTALSAGQLQVRIEAEIRAIPSYSNSVVEQKVRESLLRYFNKELRTIPSELHIGDLYEQMETTEGVQYSKLIAMRIIPYPRIVSGESNLIWNITTKKITEEILWTLTFSSNSEFELLREGEYSGTYQLNNENNLEEISFTILDGNYSAGDSWEFRTYPTNEDIIINEPSVFVLESSNIQLKVTGGV